jgi:hypothetical protein
LPSEENGWFQSSTVAVMNQPRWNFFATCDFLSQFSSLFAHRVASRQEFLGENAPTPDMERQRAFVSNQGDLS